MLTTIPFDDFISLTQRLDEGGSFGKAVFDWNYFLKLRNSSKFMVKYLNACGIKKLGQGSSRAAYALKPGDAGIKNLSGPCVLKIATHPAKGAGQNKAEAEMTEKYQHRLACFPRLYACDRQNWNYILVEMGTPLDKTPAKFRNEWLKPLREFFMDYLDKDPYPDVDEPVLDEDQFEFSSPTWCAFTIRTIAELLAGELDGVSDEEFIWYQSLIKTMSRSQIPMVRVLADVFKYAQKHGSSEVSLGDLNAPDNWAFVQRDGDMLLIPIDWGASSELMKKYYVESVTFKQLKKIVLGK